MRKPKFAFGLPLLAKELVEQSNRRRTYLIRIAYALLLFLFAFFIFWERRSWSGPNNSGMLDMLGQGKFIFTSLVMMQFMGIGVFMPAITCAVITAEKERDSLGLLILTKLGPWTILFEKLLSRMVPMLTFLLLSMPLLGFAYTLGGVSPNELGAALWMLAVFVLMTGTLTLMCSAFFRSTASAFVASYLIGFALLFALPFLDEWHILRLRNGVFVDTLINLELIDNARDIQWMFLPAYLFDRVQSGGMALHVMFWRTTPVLFASLCFLVMARLFVIRRAFVNPKNLLMKVFKAQDKLFFKLNENRLTRGVILVGSESGLPDDEAVAWRETTKKSLGTFRYLLRVFLGIQVPLGMGLLFMTIVDFRDAWQGAVLFVLLLWCLAILLVSVKSAGLVAGERSRQTLDVLMTTPYTGREIILQKFRGVRRLIIVLTIPFLTLFLFSAWCRSYMPHDRWYGYRDFDTTLYLTTTLLSITIYLPMVAWMSMLIGLKIRSHAKAIVASLASIVAWCVFPLIFVGILAIIAQPNGRSLFNFTMLGSPATIVPVNEFAEMKMFGELPWLAVAINFAVYGFCWFLFRQMCLIGADRLLGRAEPYR